MSNEASQSVSLAGDGFGAVAGEDGREDGLQLTESEDDDHGLDEHGEQDPDPVANAHAMGAEHARRPVHCLAQLSVGQRPDLAVLALPDERRRVWRDRAPDDRPRRQRG